MRQDREAMNMGNDICKEEGVGSNWREIKISWGGDNKNAIYTCMKLHTTQFIDIPNNNKNC